MATITGLNLYPIKSCAGIAMREATLTPFGLEAQGLADREWMVVDAEHRFLTQRGLPALARARPCVEAHSLRVDARGLPHLEVPLDRERIEGKRVTVEIWEQRLAAFDAGDAAAHWFSRLLDLPARLVRFDRATKRSSSARWTGGMEVLNLFSDGFPILLVSEASLGDFNERWRIGGHATLPVERFRANIVVSGLAPYDEDHVEALVGDGVELRPVKPCARCSIPSVDQQSGEIGPAPLDLLMRYRMDQRVGGATFGQNVVVAQGQGKTLRVGQQLAERWNF
ncbi:MAG: MOSC domain-containing protein [Betaproteobacteria bacterium]|nr:MAG: MOSC domain-containing protein [Betaproteobacteria bacterium]